MELLLHLLTIEVLFCFLHCCYFYPVAVVSGSLLEIAPVKLFSSCLNFQAILGRLFIFGVVHIKKKECKSPSKETKLDKRFIQCSQKVSFQGQSNPQKCKNPNKIISFKAENFCKLYIYT